MSDFKENSVKEFAISELMATIRKNSQPSTCLDAFEGLLNEIEDVNHVKVIMSDVHKVIEELMLIFKEIDKMDNNAIKARMLTYEFIQPERFFKQSLKSTNQYIYLNAAINAKFFYNNFEKGAKKWDIGKANKLGQVWNEQFYKVNDPYVDIMLKKFNMDDESKLPSYFAIDIETAGIDVIMSERQYTMDEYVKKMQEECRKIILLWNYCPAIFKAILQTKRRSLGLDNNSKRFD